MYYPREAAKDHLYNRIVMLTVACCVVLLLAAMAHKSGMLYGALSFNGVENRGSVTALEQIPMNANGKVIHYQYTDAQGQTHEGQHADERYVEHTQYEVDGPITLLVSPWMPDKSCIASQLQSYRTSFCIMTGGVLLALLFLLISGRTFWQIQAMKEQDRFY
ncbi:MULTISPECIES: DUF3592 domain-containing protein [Pseudomonas]|jgi:hypothetical protein|uniref:DUF3592 domain-containing protein n=1 Tax=Pseudomonas TaxID=286 RepID=UPI0002726286|nr:MULTISPECIES: DUF3592 domain-containing protein [Pseudomonas]EJM08504.1 hypothetical protein PMI19_00063 [Pseudomonas sp. GM16]EJM33367.1 hypothetical protein PMI23_03987 [Pseudomonas sp. GM24]MBY8933452.1 hypothetical protein [Pseudomonas fluorescens]